jgi:4'-phosphopantetheinyl transferase
MILAPNEIHVWRIYLACSPVTTAMLCAVLSRTEQERARHIRIPHLRDRWIVAHGALRCILANYLRSKPEALTFSTGTHGKPELVWPAQNIAFNLAHSRDTALLAVSASHPIGIDVEHIQEDLDISSMTQLFFSDEELQALLALPVTQQRRAFFVTWTRKEAFAKAVGFGLSLPLTRLTVSIAPDQPARFLSIEGHDHGQWSLVDLSDSDAAASIAVRAHAPTVRYMHFPLMETSTLPFSHLPHSCVKKE